MSDTTLWVAIIGAGPAGYYTAEALTKNSDNAKVNVRVDIIDRLPTPYGLIRAGVAPDHQSIKNVSKRYEATNNQDNVRFVGNLALGRDITLKELQTLYDVVILATGAPNDRELGVEGEKLNGVIGASAFVGWYNSHPDYVDLSPELKVPSVAVIGNGNVAIDVARILAKTAKEMQETDLADHAAKDIHSSSIKDIYILGRRGPLEASFTPKEMSELNDLENCVALVKADQLPPEDIDGDLKGPAKKNMMFLRKMANNTPDMKPVRLHLMFYRRPMAILGHDRVCGIRLEHTKVDSNGKCTGLGDSEVLPAELIVSCIGYKSSPIEDVAFDTSLGRYISDDGLISDRLYCVGWARRGPTGTIGTNKPDGNAIAAKIIDEIKPQGREGRAGLDRLAKERDLSLVTFKDWKKIEAAEEEAAADNHPRSKFTDIEHMVKIAES